MLIRKGEKRDIDGERKRESEKGKRGREEGCKKVLREVKERKKGRKEERKGQGLLTHTKYVFMHARTNTL